MIQSIIVSLTAAPVSYILHAKVNVISNSVGGLSPANHWRTTAVEYASLAKIASVLLLLA
jgi:hypothetical protein